jgi:hypothetical protein
MRRNLCLIGLMSLIFFLFIYQSADAAVLKWIRVGKYQTKVIDSGDQSESAGEGTFSYYYSHQAMTRSTIDHAGWQLGTVNWTDDQGNLWPVKISGAPHGNSDETINTMPIPDENGIYIHRYFRYQPPTITVDGSRLDEPFPMTGDEVAPTKITGTADVMIESWINTSMGISIHQKVFGWSQKHHDDYILFDWTLTNTGNIDIDDEIELPTQVLQDVYFERANNFLSGYSRNWASYYGEYPGDSLRIAYAYPQRTDGASRDDFGDPRPNGLLRRSHYIGEVMLHVDKSTTEHTDDPAQPQMTGVHTAELPWIKLRAELNGPSDWALCYQTMKLGFLPYDGTPELEGTWPGHHSTRMDERGVKFVTDFSWWNWRQCAYTASGPYTFNPGESIRIVWATVMGNLSPEMQWKIGKEFNAGTCTWDGPDDLADYYPPFRDYPDLAPEPNDRAKDRWVCTGKDSLFDNAWAAQWATRNDYNVTVPPPPPSVEIKSLPDKITVLWGNESESASDFAGYRIYRTEGAPDYDESGGQVVGKWIPIYECGAGTANPTVVHSYDDASAVRGVAYFYYVSAFDDGSENVADVRGVGESLESGQFLNRTTVGAHLTRTAGTLASVRVVPNPFNITARDLQFIGEPDKIMFMDLPPVCTIYIYSENGSLVKTIEHTNGSGDEPWGGVIEEHSTTDTGQVIVSGIYIAHIVTPEGESTNVKFVVVR